MSTSKRTKRRVVLRRVFSDPHNWCDRQCERCPLFDRCGVPLLERRQRADDEARGVDPDDTMLAAERATEQLAAMVGEVASMSVDPFQDAAGLPDLGVDPAILEEAGLALVLATPVAARVAGGDRTAPILVASLKSARVACVMSVGGGETWAADVVPNLMLLEDSRAKIAELVAEIDPGGGLAAAFARWSDVVEPLLASIDDEAREVMDVLIRTRAAPSPFCVVEVRAQLRDAAQQ